MDLKLKSEPLVASVFEMDIFLEKKGYDVIPFRDDLKTGFLITKENIVIKKGVQRYDNWKEGRKEVLNKLCKVLGL